MPVRSDPIATHTSGREAGRRAMSGISISTTITVLIARSMPILSSAMRSNSPR